MSFKTSAGNPKKPSGVWLLRIRRYFGEKLGNFYARPVNRLTLYPLIFTFFLAECTTFWLIYIGKSFFLNYMSFVMIYSLHKAAVYSLCIFAADTAAHHLIPGWAAYGRRTVGGQWLIWTIGLLVGFAVQRTMVNSLIIYYAPEVITYFMARPELKLSNLELLLYLTPYWCLVVFVTLRIAWSKQQIQDRAGDPTLLPDDGKQAAPQPLLTNRPEKRKKRLPSGHLNWENESGNVSVPLADITHITVEDHYCRINYSTGSGFKNTMIRSPLKKMMLKLPKDHFIKIHRSHVVNTAHMSRLKKKGRDYRIVIENAGLELPVSRSRFKVLAPLIS